MGYWSYPVEEFTWEHFTLGDPFIYNIKVFQRKGFDIVFHEDGGNYGTYTQKGTLPLVYLAIDSTLSDVHFERRLEQARQADLVLVDHDRLERFTKCKQVRRLSYCVNDRVFQPTQHKVFDVAFHCSAGSRRGMPGGETRTMIRGLLHDVCTENNWKYSSGALGLQEYAFTLASARVCVNWTRTEINRPHRVFDTMAARTCLVTNRLPEVSGEPRLAGMDYVEVDNPDQLTTMLETLLASGEYNTIAESGYKFVTENHTWAIRAKQLRKMLAEEFAL